MGDSLRHRRAFRDAAACDRRGGLVAVAYSFTCSSCGCGYSRGAVLPHAAGDGGRVLCVQNADTCAELSEEPGHAFCVWCGVVLEYVFTGFGVKTGSPITVST